MDNKAASDKHENNGADNSSGNRIATSEIPVKNSKEEQAVHSSLTTTTTTAAISVLSSGDTSSVATKMTGSPPITRDISNPLLPPRSLTVDGNTPATSHRISNNAPEETFIVPDNFALVAPFIYRSSFPKRKNFSFFKRVGIKSVLTLILEEYPEQNQRFMEENGMKLFQFGVAGNKEPFVDIPEDVICAALAVLLDRRNHPIVIHCNKGKHRTGCLVGCLRKLQHWSHTAIFDEYRRYAHPKARSMDQQFIELFDCRNVWPLVNYRWLPPWPTIAEPWIGVTFGDMSLDLKESNDDHASTSREEDEGVNAE